jgi:hypothetical protein
VLSGVPRVFPKVCHAVIRLIYVVDLAVAVAVAVALEVQAVVVPDYAVVRPIRLVRSCSVQRS